MFKKIVIKAHQIENTRRITHWESKEEKQIERKTLLINANNCMAEK